jgi:parallel beta-helix repeat protein
VKTYSNPEVKNNYITNCNTGIDISYGSSPEVHNNEIYGCYNGISVRSDSHPNIKRNILNAYYGVCCRYTFINMHYNNLNCYNYAIALFWYSQPIGVDINAENNYFYTTNETEIQELIYDKNDVEEQYQEFVGIVNYFPFLTQEYKNAGIQNE